MGNHHEEAERRPRGVCAFFPCSVPGHPLGAHYCSGLTKRCLGPKCGHLTGLEVSAGVSEGRSVRERRCCPQWEVCIADTDPGTNSDGLSCWELAR